MTRLSNLMNRVLHLTRSGHLKDATAAIQAALGRGPVVAPVRPEADVIDLVLREVAQPSSPIVDASAAVPTAVPQKDGAAGSATAFFAGVHTSKAGSRAYKLFVPPGHEGRSLPLLVMLHGCTQDPDDFAAGTRMNDAAGRDGFFVLYPAQSAEHNPQRCWNWFKHNHQSRDRGEPALLAGMTSEVVDRFGIDRQRVYVAGLSAGGAMAAILGDAYPDVYAAVGVHSGLATGSARDVASAFAAMQGRAAPRQRSGVRPPTIVFHGDEDRTVHPVNGEQVLAAGAAAAQVERVTGHQGRAFTQHIHRDAAGRVQAEHWVVHGAGHAWSGGHPRGSHADAQGPDASAEMLRFFRLHRLHRLQS